MYAVGSLSCVLFSVKSPLQGKLILYVIGTIMQKLDFTTVDVVYRTDNRRVFPVPQMINVQCVADLFYTVLNIKADSATASTLLKLLLPDLILRNQAIIKHYFRMVV